MNRSLDFDHFSARNPINFSHPGRESGELAIPPRFNTIPTPKNTIQTQNIAKNLDFSSFCVTFTYAQNGQAPTSQEGAASPR